jgi:hypothetical protein
MKEARPMVAGTYFDLRVPWEGFLPNTPPRLSIYILGVGKGTRNYPHTRKLLLLGEN